MKRSFGSRRLGTQGLSKLPPERVSGISYIRHYSQGFHMFSHLGTFPVGRGRKWDWVQIGLDPNKNRPLLYVNILTVVVSRDST